jgi:hypothetical protein
MEVSAILLEDDNSNNNDSNNDYNDDYNNSNNDYNDDNDSDNNSNNDNNNEINVKKRDRPKNQLWDHFKETDVQKDGHRGWKCNYCGDVNTRASNSNMNAHLALHCQIVPAKIKQDILRNFPVPKKNKTAIDIATGAQPRIDNKFQQIKKLDSGQEQLCHKSLTKFFVCCGIPFWTVESPFFLDFCKNLCVSYKPPDRKTLSND